MKPQTMTIQEYAKKIFPDPINGSWSDKEDFELRLHKAQLQRHAFVKGFELAQMQQEYTIKELHKNILKSV